MPSTRRLLDGVAVMVHHCSTLVDSTQVWAPTLVQLDQKAVAVAAHAAHSVIAMEDGTFRTFGNGDHGRLGCLDRFNRADPRDKGLPVEMALPAEPKKRLKPHEYFGETERRYA